MRMTATATAIMFAAGIAFAAQFPKAADAVAEFQKSAAKVTQEQKGETTYYVARDAKGAVIKVAYLKNAKGYKGRFSLFAIVVKNGTGLAFESVRLVEGKDKYKEVTKGHEEAFMKQFAGKAADKDSKQMKLDAMTSATQTSRTIMRALDQERDNLLVLFGLKK